MEADSDFGNIVEPMGPGFRSSLGSDSVLGRDINYIYKADKRVIQQGAGIFRDPGVGHAGSLFVQGQSKNR